MELQRALTRLAALGALVSMVALNACAQTLDRSIVYPTDLAALDRQSRFLKVHMLDGEIYVLSEWQVDAEDRLVSGRGTHLNANREGEPFVPTQAPGVAVPTKASRESTFTIPLDSVALFETNVAKTSPVVAALAVPLVPAAFIAASCISDPKSCFGSCPTFYVWDGERALLQAEGFSSSVAPALGASDIDALYRARPLRRKLEVRMTNEALETHVVRRVDILAARRPENGRVVATPDGVLLEAVEMTPPSDARAREGDILGQIDRFDGVERYSTADERDLATREIIDLVFTTVPDGDLGLVLASRQTLLSTYLFYQSLAYMGSSAGRWLAALERGDGETIGQANAVRDLLGRIEVLVYDEDRQWVSVGNAGETGPIATEVHLIRLGEFPGRRYDRPLRVRLRLTQGLWRIDFVALAKVGSPVAPLRLEPTRVVHQGSPENDVKELLLDPNTTLVTFPRDAYTLEYELPEDFGSYELFLESRGYYIEWMREEWLAEENPLRAAAMFLNPRQAVQSLAPEFKRVEARMEEVFWGSRYACQ